MPFAKLNEQGELAQYPYSFADLLRDHPDLPEDFGLGGASDASAFGVVPVIDSEPPAIEEGQELVEIDPAKIDGEWRRQYRVEQWMWLDPGKPYGREIGGALFYPYSVADLVRDLADDAPGGSVVQIDGEWGIVDIHPTNPPKLQPGEAAEEALPTFDKGKWRQQWRKRARTEEELVAAKAEIVAAVNALLEARRAATAPTPHGPIAIDLASQIKITGAALAALTAMVDGEAFAVKQQLADGAAVDLDAEGMIALGKAVSGHLAALDAAAFEKIATINEGDFAALAAIDIEAGWPE
jgi:hypothetical protein